MIPARYSQALFGLILSGLMSFIVTCVASVKAVGLGAHTFGAWMGAWSLSWPIAFAVVLVAAPRVRKLVSKLVAPEA
ncbi:MAG: DUF2798 domain-containing protein [Rhodobacteraceae bacterium]|jgi:Na+-translocating ferredoxin:NAD+ oxidoreductase RnfD subunit|nr:DUF2798 domain-containing protein [Paracoccaceae bacterium]